MKDGAQGSHRFEINSITLGLVNIQSVACVAIKHVLILTGVYNFVHSSVLSQLSVLLVAIGIQSWQYCPVSVELP